MTLGFTGTSKGMTNRQRTTVKYLLFELQPTGLHHGDCTGADAQAHQLALDFRIRVSIHPPTDPKKRAFCRGYATIYPPFDYLTRNRHIVREGIDGLIAAPKDFVQPKSLRGQGTWTTVGYARQAKRRIWFVFPDGTFKEERNANTT